MATAIPFGDVPQVYNNGSALSGGKIYFYVPGTSTLRTPYSDTALSVPTTNPVLLNSAGWPATNIYLDSSLAYDYIIKSADDSETLWPRTTIPSNAEGSQPVDATLTAIAGLTVEDGDHIEATGTDTFRTVKRSVATLAALQALTGNQLNDVVAMLGRTAAGDDGDGIFRFSTADLSTEVAADEVTASQGNGGVYIAPASDKTGASGAWVRMFTGPVTPQMYGATGDGTTDDSAAITAAETAAQAAGTIVTFPPGTYAANGLDFSIAFEMEAGAKLLYNGAQNGTLLTISGSSLVIPYIATDANGEDCTQVLISGNSNVVDTVSVQDGVASATSATSIYGLSVTGNNNVIHKTIVRNFANTGQANQSFPQAIFTSGDHNEFLEIDSNGSASVLVTGSSSGLTTVGRIVAREAGDNGVYQLGGDLVLDAIHYHGTEEPIIFKGQATVGEIHLYGSCLGIGLEDSGDITIGEIHISEDSTGATASFIFRLRSGNTASGRLTIGNVVGKMQGSSLFLASTGTMEYLTILGMDIDFIYDAAIATSISSWARFTGADGFNLRDCTVRIIDEADVTTGSSLFTMTCNSSTVKESYYYNNNFVVYQSDGETAAAGLFRGANFAQTKIKVQGAGWRTAIGPYIQSGFLNGMSGNFADQAPVGGTWRAGERLYDYTPSASGVEGWVCVTAGTPGTWKAFGSIAS